MTANRITVAAVQMVCEPGRVDANLERAAQFVETAARRGAQLALLPELMPCGYQLSEAMWECAESFDGRIVGWLASLARQHGIYLGTTLSGQRLLVKRSASPASKPFRQVRARQVAV
jgi:N-carbamoylputrescine amidase